MGEMPNRLANRDIDWMQFANDIKIIRCWVGEDGRDLAEAIKVSASTICRAEQGKPVTADTYMLLCRRLRLDPFKYLTPRIEQ